MNAPAPTAPITVDVWSDAVCPWCYIGKHKFEAALAELGDELAVTVRYHAFQLDPTTPPGTAKPIPEVYASKFGPERAHQAIERVTSVAADLGLEFRLDRALMANTRMAHRLVWLAGEPGSPAAQDVLYERLLRAHFSDGLDLGDPDTLANLAAEVGFDREYVRGWLDTDAGIAEVAADLSRAGDYGITSVPTFVINGQWAVPGAQDTDTFVDVLRRVNAMVGAND